MHAMIDGEEKKKKKKTKREKEKHKGDALQDLTAEKLMDSEKENGKHAEVSGEDGSGKVTEKFKQGNKKRKKKQIKDAEKSSEDHDEKKVVEKTKRRKRRTKKGHSDDVKGVEMTGEGRDEEVLEKLERKKRKRKKGKSMKDLGTGNQDIAGDNLASAGGNRCSTDDELQGDDSKGKRKKANLGKSCSANSETIKGKKKVRFSGEVEFFPLSADSNSNQSKGGGGKLVQGKRFSREEDDIVKEAVFKYIKEHGLGEEGLDMVLNCGSHPKVRGCWNHIATAIPHRPKESVYYRAQVLFRRGEKRRWTEEDYELVREFHEKHGNQWKMLADDIGKHRFHVKDTWRRIKLRNRKKGHWSQEEYQNLFDLVNTDLRLKLFEEKKSKHGMLRDNIHWTAISDKLSTRSDALCCLKWYNQLTSPMVAEGVWVDTDDYRLINELYCLDASCIEDVDWDNLLEHRSGDVCRKRWNQMVLHIGQHGTKSFAEQVEVLANRYLPDLIEVRESWDNKPIVP